MDGHAGRDPYMLGVSQGRWVALRPIYYPTQGSDPRAKLLLPRLNLMALISLDSRPFDVCLQMRPKAMLSRSVFTLAMLRTLAATPSQYALMEILFS